MKKTTRLVDVDGVLLNWISAFDHYMHTNYGYNVQETSSYALETRYGIVGDALGYIEDFNHSPAIGNLEPMRDAVEYVTKLAEDGSRFIVITSLSKNDSACFHRIANLERVFGDVFDDYVFLGIGESKRDALSKFKGTGYHWIEDLPKNAVDGLDFGLKTHIMRQSYNMDFHHPEINFARSWKELYPALLEKELKIA